MRSFYVKTLTTEGKAPDGKTVQAILDPEKLRDARMLNPNPEVFFEIQISSTFDLKERARANAETVENLRKKITTVSELTSKITDAIPDFKAKILEVRQ